MVKKLQVDTKRLRSMVKDLQKGEIPETVNDINRKVEKIIMILDTLVGVLEQIEKEG